MIDTKDFRLEYYRKSDGQKVMVRRCASNNYDVYFPETGVVERRTVGMLRKEYRASKKNLKNNRPFRFGKRAS
jgi:hypothetical protein